MPRNYKKEAQWAKGKYKVFFARLKKDDPLAEQLQAQLDEQGIKFTQWVRERIREMIKDIEEDDQLCATCYEVEEDCQCGAFIAISDLEDD